MSLEEIQSIDNKILNKIAHYVEAGTDKELALYIGVPISTMKKLRAGDAVSSWSQRFQMAESCGLLGSEISITQISEDELAKDIERIITPGVYAKRNFDALLCELLLNTPSLKMNKVFLGLISHDKLIKVQQELEVLSIADRCEMISSLGRLNKRYWGIDQEDVWKFASSSRLLYEHLSNQNNLQSNQDSKNTDLLDGFKRVCQIKTDTELASILELTKQGIRQLRNRKAAIPLKSRVLMKIELQGLKKDKKQWSINRIDSVIHSSESLISTLDA
ncbi:MAG: hypothetical protein C9356_19925 [Oleiphilus sp.]|nr:MAG: hypothetical protein C9356_19925 [Oleiphilus sp.]